MGGRARYCYSEVLPFIAVIISLCSNVAVTTAFKAAASQGISYRVFMVYAHSLAGLVLLPFAFIFERKKRLPPLNFSFISRIFLLGLIGFLGHVLGYMGLEYSTPTVSSIISNLTPAFTFALAIIFRMEKLKLKSFRSQAKIVGSIVSISGAIVVILYKGPAILNGASPSKLFYQLGSSQSDWIMGGVLFAVAYLLVSLWYIAQAEAVKKYPAEQLVTSLYNLVVASIALPVAYIFEPDFSAWKINSGTMVMAILIAGLVAFSFATAMLTWSLRVKGAVYVAIFTPMSIVAAAIMGVIFLGDSLYIASVIGALIVAFGFYVSLWGKAEEETVDLGVSSNNLESQSPENVPLLE